MAFNPGGSGGIAGASDVAFSSLQNNQVLNYESSSAKWKNATFNASSTVTTKTVTNNYAIVAGDVGVYLRSVSATAHTITLNTAVPVGSVVTGVQAGSGQVTIAGATLMAGNRSKTLEQGSYWRAIRTTNGWDLSGDLTGTGATPSGIVYFDSQLQSRGDLSAYPTGNNQSRITVVNDPAGITIGGAPRKVLKFNVREQDNQLTGNPRAQIETPTDFFEGDDIFIGYSVYLPNGAQGSGEFFPSSLPSGGTTWLNLGEIYGPPYNGRSAVMIGMKSGHAGLSFQRNGTYAWDTVWTTQPVQKGIWYDWVLHEKLSTNPAVGFVEMWQNTGSGWVKQAFAGSTNPLYMKTLDTAHDGSANYHKLALYYQSNMGFGSIQAYHGPHKVGSTFDIVAPTSYS